MEEIRCPKCGSDNVQSVKMIYMQGTTDKASVSITNIGEYVTATEGGSQTLLAQAIAPPSKKETFGLEDFFNNLGMSSIFKISFGFAIVVVFLQHYFLR